MPLFGRRSPSPPADWAEPLNADQYPRFVETIQRTLDELKVPGEREPRADGTLSIKNQEGQPSQVGLQNLAQLMVTEPVENWSRLARDHFLNLITPVEIPGERDAMMASLRVRFWPPEFFAAANDAVYRSVAPGLMLGLAIDLPTRIGSINKEQLEKWNLPEDEAWEVARQNTATEPVEVVTQPGPKGTSMTFLLANNFYVSSHALWLDRHLSLHPERGALVGIPTRHLVVAHAIDDLGVLPVVGVMIGSNQKTFREGPGSITPNLYWWRQGNFVHIPSEEREGKPSIIPPDSFVQLLNSLAPKA